MPEQDKWFPESAFDSEIKQETVVALQSQQNAVTYLRGLFRNSQSVHVLIGERQSGKSTIVEQFIAGLRGDTAVASLDGSDMTPDKLVAEALAQYGYQMDLGSADDLLRLLKIFAIQQTRSCEAPVLVVENIQDMAPAALRALCLVATFSHQGRFAVRIILTGTCKAIRLFDAAGMTAISKRIEPIYEVKALTRHEAMVYLQGRLVGGGITTADRILPMNVCDKIYEMSEGLPGQLNAIAQRTLQQAVAFPASEADVVRQERIRKMTHSTPRIILTLNGEVIEEYTFKDRKVIIGRSNLADIVIHNEYASKFHLLLLHYDDALVLVDLNSANGTFVNSVKVSSTILKNDDIVSLATYRIKILDAPESKSDNSADALQDTAKMKTLEDMREKRSMIFPYLHIRRRKNR